MLRTGIISFLILALSAGIIFVPSGQVRGVDQAQAATAIASARSGNWSSSSTWVGGNVPKQGDTVTISSGHTVTYNVLSDAVLGEVNIHGTLYFSRTTNTRLKTNASIVVRAGGFLNMGTPDDFIPRTVKAELIWQLTQEQANAFVPVTGMHVESRSPGLYALSGSRWEVHGEPLLRTWSKLALDAPAGATSVVVENDVTDWYVGGTVALSPTNLPTEFYWSERLGKEQSRQLDPQHELRAITSLEALPGGQTRITLDKPLDFLHEGTAPIRGEVGLLTRNVVIRTELLGVAEQTLIDDVRTRKFAHTMYTPGARGDLQYVEFKFMGHYGLLGVYATHHHMLLETAKGMVIRGTSGWYNGFRCVNLHLTHGVLVEDNVCFNAQSVSFFVEREDSLGINTDNAFVRNLAIANAPKPFVDRNDKSIAGEHGERGGVDFWAGEKTTSEAFLGNVSAGSAPQGDGGASGFFFPERGNGLNKLGFMDFTFVSNEVRSKHSSGIFSWQNQGGTHTRDIVDMRLLRNGDKGIHWGAYSNPMRFYNAQFLENGRTALSITSNNTFLQDSVVSGAPVTGSLEDFGFFINAYIRHQSPGHPVWIVRNHFKDLTTAIFQRENECRLDEDIRDRPLLEGDCSGFYTMQMGNTFENVGQTISFGMQPNPNSFARVFDYPGSINGHKDFVLARPDLLDNPEERGIITEKLINGQTFNSPDIDALLTPMSSLPVEIEFTGILNQRPRDQQFRSPPGDFTFFNAPDYPPEITLEVRMNGTVATVTAHATDDKEVERVEFFVDWIPIVTLTSPSAGANRYRIMVDLANLPDESGVAPRKYAYLYARAFDGTVHLERGSFAYEQRAYSNVIEVGPEVLVAGQSLPSQPSPQPTPGSTPEPPDQPVLPVLTTINIAPSAGTVQPGAAIQFSATGLDQSGNPMSVTPTWSVSGGGNISETGVFTAGSSEGGPFTVTATVESVSATATVTVADQLIASITASNEANYLRDTLEAGKRVYVDRNFVFTDVPLQYIGQEYILTANDDKDGTNADSLSFSLGVAATVYVAYDERASALPSWLDSSWTLTRDIIGTTDVQRQVFQKAFPAGTVTLGSNAVPPMDGARSNYNIIVVVVPAAGSPDAPANQPPQVSISSPANGASVTAGSSITFSGSATDPEGGALTGPALVWISSRDGQLGTGQSLTATLSTGSHTITLTATDSRGAAASASVSITVNSGTGSATLSLGSAAGLPGQNAEPPIVLDTQGTPVRSIHVNLAYDGAILTQVASERGGGLPQAFSFSWHSPAPGELRLIALS